MRRRIIGALVAGAAGTTLALLPLSSASAHDHDGNNWNWNHSSHSRWVNNWDDDDDCGNSHGNWHHHGDWGRWDNANWSDDWGGWR
ncbi:hypothetical protein ABZ743_12815 [Streptomyces sp. NPDC006662]|uniref:hypothetical protein n=1 Tax=Streptomyces sp. NPDC006662 TaxID=3156902 RepID=UPI00340A2430